MYVASSFPVFLTAFFSTEDAIVKAIAIVKQKGSLLPSVTHQDLYTSSSSSIIRKRFHPLGPLAALHCVARSKLELVLIEVLKLLGPTAKAEVLKKLLNSNNKEVEMMVDFAECIEPTSMSNCSIDSPYRTADGTCNNVYNPLQGASNTAFGRYLSAVYEDGISTPVGHSQQVKGNPYVGPWPSPRKVSELMVKDVPKLSISVTHMFPIWGQFVDHDLDLSAEFDTHICEESCDLVDTWPFCYPIKVSPTDSVFGKSGPNRGNCLPLTRSVGVCMRPHNNTFDLARQQINQLTHYLDASNVYGSTQELADSLRLFSGGLLRQGGRTHSQKGNLPFGEELSNSNVPFFVAGDVRANEHVALTIMHTIWLREHNRIADELAKLNPCWDDERLYQEARKIVGAIMQVITYKEFLPLLFGQKGFDIFVGPYKGYSYNVDASIPNSFASAAFRFGHSLIKSTFTRLDKNNKPLPAGPLGLRESFFNPLQYFISGGTDPILRGMLVDKSKELDEFVSRILTTQLFAPSDKELGQDLVARNIQRAREHGIPSYRQFQKYCYDLFGITSKFPSHFTENKFKQVYGPLGFSKGIDLWIGGMSEQKVYGSLLGPTFSCIIGKAFANVRDGDRFFWENPGVFTEEQRQSLSSIRLSKVVCNTGDDITSIIPKAFETGQAEVYCSDLPDVDLTLWKDNCQHY